MRNNLGWPCLRIQHPANSADTRRLTVFSSLTSPQSNCKRGAVARGEQSASLPVCPAQSTALSEGLFRVLIQFGVWGLGLGLMETLRRTLSLSRCARWVEMGRLYIQLVLPGRVEINQI